MPIRSVFVMNPGSNDLTRRDNYAKCLDKKSNNHYRNTVAKGFLTQSDQDQTYKLNVLKWYVNVSF